MSKQYAQAFQQALKSVANGIETVGNYTSAAANKANSISAASQAAQGAFNQASVNNANAITNNNLANQYAYNSAQAALANQYNTNMWNQTASWNEQMWQRQADFNAQQAQINRDWQKEMESTKYQRAVADMEKAGINPILASGGVSVGAGGGSSASVGAASMSPMQGTSASGGVIGGASASESSYTGQMEYLSGTLGLMSVAIAGITSAVKAMNDIPKGNDIIKDIFNVWENYTPAGRVEKFGREKVGPMTDSYIDKIRQKIKGSKN